MARRPTPQAGQLVHITQRCHNQSFLFNLKKQWPDLVSWINCLWAFYQVEVHHFLFMDNHLHLLLTPRLDNAGRALGYVFSGIARFINFETHRINRVFGARYHATQVDRLSYLRNVIQYLYQNPVKANLVSSCAEYPYSTLGQYLGTCNDGIMFYPDPLMKRLFDQGASGLLAFRDFVVESNLSNSDAQIVQKSLSKSTYGYSREQLKQMANSGSRLVL
jgi:putative transposase